VWLLPHVFSVVGFLLAFFLLARVLREGRPPANTLAWVLAIVLVPYLSVPLYLLFGGRKHRRLAARKDPLYGAPLLHCDDPTLNGIERIVVTGGAPRSRGGAHVELLSNGEETFARVLELFKGARTSIDVSTFILGRDATGQALIDALCERARAGVRVRLLLDGLFVFRSGRRLLRQLIRAGGHYAVFMPLLRLPFRGPANLRNHRKIIVVDSEIAMLGGMNLAEEYMGPAPHTGRWLDVSMLIEGPAVAHIHNVFRSDWAFASREAAAPSAYPLLKRVGDATLQVVASGPDVPGDTYYDAMLTALFQAHERVWIATPYFIPDDALARGLVLAVRRGVDVRVLVPYQSNHMSADLAGASYLRQIATAGGRVHRYLPGMMHAKLVLIDRQLAILGSANFDMRSLFLDYEIAVFAYTQREVALFSAWFEGVLPYCDEDLPKPGIARQWAEDMGRLVAPLL